MHMSNSMEIRNFRSDQYFAGQPGQMPGSNNFMAEAVIRVIAPMYTEDSPPPQFLFGNASSAGAGSGWFFAIVPAEDISGQRIYAITFGVVGSSNLSAQANIAMGSVMGKTLHLAAVVQTFDGGEGETTIATLFVNGTQLASDTDDNYTTTPSSDAPCIGYSPTFSAYGALEAASVLSVGYTELEAPTTSYDNMQLAVGIRFLETMKRAEVLATVNDDISENEAMPYVYAAYTSGFGVPSVLTNKGSMSPAGNLAKAGDGTTLITTATYTEWGAPVVVEAPAEIV